MFDVKRILPKLSMPCCMDKVLDLQLWFIFQLLGFLATVAHIIQINWIYKIFSRESDEDEFDGRGKLD
jgi:hypothetical protein